MADETQGPPSGPVTKKSRRGMAIAIAGVLVLAGGGGAAYWFMRPAEAKAEDAPAAPKEPAAGLVGFDPFIVNLADGAGARFLRVNVQLVVAGEDTAAAIDENAVTKVRLRAALLELLAQQESRSLVTPEGKAALKAAIAERAGAILEPHKVLDVLFADFIVQF